MSDRIPCPDCGGRGSRVYRGPDGNLELACLFCGAEGEVGGSNEPAEVHEYSEPPEDGHPVWMSAAVEGLPGCRYCLGSGKTTHLPENSRTVIVAPCPACQSKSSG